MKALALFLALALSAAAAAPVGFRTEKAGFVSLNIYHPDGTVARELLIGAPFTAGPHEVAWDGLADGKPLPAGEYAWRAVFHQGLDLKPRGAIGDFGGDHGSPSAVAADATQVYLGWSGTTGAGDAVVACDPAGVVRWTHRRGALSGCRALAADSGSLFVLGGEGPDADGGALYRLDAKDGRMLPWPDGRTDLKITSLWPGDGKGKPEIADYLAVKNGRIYLSFTAGEFLAVLDAKTGGYLQTVVGAPPGAVDSVATKTDSPDQPGKIVDADFVVTALQGAVLGKLLLVHDPIWVLVSDLTPLERDERITALTMIGDGAKHRRHDIFIGLGLPLHHVQARSALATEGFSFTAGQPGGRPPLGPWQPQKMKAIRALALDAKGQLWVAEGDDVPGRVSVWSTDTAEGRLVREFFAPPGSPAAAVHPRDPAVVFAGGCEWRLGAKMDHAACLGVVTRDAMRAARYAVEKDRTLLILSPAAGGPDLVFERAGDGDFKPATTPAPPPSAVRFSLRRVGPGWQIMHDGFALGLLAPALTGTPVLTESSDGKVFLTSGRPRLSVSEITGLKTLRPLASGKLTLGK